MRKWFPADCPQEAFYHAVIFLVNYFPYGVLLHPRSFQHIATFCTDCFHSPVLRVTSHSGKFVRPPDKEFRLGLLQPRRRGACRSFLSTSACRHAARTRSSSAMTFSSEAQRRVSEDSPLCHPEESRGTSRRVCRRSRLCFEARLVQPRTSA